MAHVLHRISRRFEASMNARRTSRKLDAILRDPHLAKDIGRPLNHRAPRKPYLW